ncbi:hypothetical protein JCM10207_002101 [Rhodosporidiobolus poonsookiae]
MESLHAQWVQLPPTHPSQTVLASPALWDALLDVAAGSTSASFELPPTQLTLSVKARHAAQRNGKSLGAVQVRVREAAKADLASVEVSPAFAGARSSLARLKNAFVRTQDPASKTLLVPASLASAHPSLFSRRSPTLLLSLSQSVPLSSVILLSLDTASFDLASSSETALEAQLSSDKADLLREGDVVRMEAGRKRWKVAMTEPVLQGAVVKGYTRLLVLPPTEEQDVETASVSEAEEPLAQLDSSEDDSFDFEIDESFLAASLLAPRRSGNSAYPTPLTSPIPPNSLALTNGSSFPLHAISTSSQTPKASSGTLVAVAPLLHPVPSEALSPPPDADEDDVARAFATTTYLGRLGLFSGDWVVLRTPASEQVDASTDLEAEKVRKDGRLVRVFAVDELAEASRSTPSEPPHLHLPPPLLLNLLGSAAFSPSPTSEPSLVLFSAPSVSSTILPPFPTASSVTLARLASPHSVNKVFQPLFLDGLKDHFQNKQRTVKQGDVVAVAIDEERVRFLAPAGEGKEGADEDVDLPQGSSAPTAVVHFIITSLSVDPPSSPLSAPNSTEIDHLLEDGRLGCIVDPKVTKLLQTGVERGRIPDCGGWLGVPSSAPPVSLAPNILGDPTPASRLYDFLTSSLEPRARSYGLPLTVLLKGARGSGKKTVVKGVAAKAGVSVLDLDCFDLLSDTDLKTEGRLRALAVDKALACAPCVLLLRNIEAMARKSQAMETGQEPPMTTVLRECFDTIREGWQTSGQPVVVVATTTDVEKVPTGVLGLFKEEIGIDAPAEPERLAILRNLTSSDLIAPDVSLRSLAVQTAALVASDLVDLVKRARAAAAERVLDLTSSAASSGSDSPLSLADIAAAGVSLTSVDFNAALEKARSAYSESIGAPKIPNVTWDDVGGLANVKSDILDTIQLPLERPELFADGLKKRSGILLYGPPGTGKTLLAKAVATSCSLNFFSVKGPELLNMYIGESEANVRRVFQRARDAKPCVIFFDELDSVAPKRGNQGDSGGVMDRIVSQLLAELDGMSEGKGGNDVFVIGATNRPDLLDPALLRPGRFDRMLYLGVSDTHSAQLKIIQALTRKFKLAPEMDLARVAEKCPFNYTGADFYALCSDAMLKAMTRKAWKVDAKIAELNSKPPYSTGAAPLLTPQYYLAEIATPAEIEVLVSQQDFEAALAELVPSVSQAEMDHYKKLQSAFSEDKAKSADEEKEGNASTFAAPSPAATFVPAAPSLAPPTINDAMIMGTVEQERTLPPQANGLVQSASDGCDQAEETDEEEKARRRKAKGKGKAREE